MAKRRDIAVPVVVSTVLLLIGLIFWATYDGYGRSRAGECAGEMVLFAPGTWDPTWCIKKWDSWGYMDDNFVYQDQSGFVTVRCYQDETEARRACTDGVQPTESR